ncbi:MAG: hypothetical protein OXD49_20890 [Candidatus Poribacteria bacterium]|nr:hypothetical protein [Candidatus Poribacteria bacterium]
MVTINPKYIVDDKGDKTAAVLTMKEYHLLIKCLEDLEDILEMDSAVETETDFRDYQEIRSDLKKEGKLHGHENNRNST